MIFFKALFLLPPIGKPIRAGYLWFVFGDYFYVVATPGSLQIQEKIQTYQNCFRSTFLPYPQWQIALVFTGIFFISIFTDQLHQYEALNQYSDIQMLGSNYRSDLTAFP